jgi:hypothetical protein
MHVFYTTIFLFCPKNLLDKLHNCDVMIREDVHFDFIHIRKPLTTSV